MYATVDELKKALGWQLEAIFKDYSDTLPENPGEETETDRDVEITRILTEASDTIDELIKTRVTVPITAGNALLKRICLTIAKYDIYSSLATQDVPEVLAKAYDNSIKLLERISRGEIDLGAVSADAPVIIPEFSSSTQQISAHLN